MTNQSTIDKLIEMRLTTMADAFRNQLNDSKFKEVPFEDRFGMLVDIEYSNRKNNRQKRLIHNAGFDQPEASIMDINYTSGRKLNKELINRLATCEYISEHRNLFITGATGCGKTYMACAFGMEACKQYYNTSMSVCQTYSWIWTLHELKGTTAKLWQNIPIQCFSFWMNGYFSNQLIQSRKISSNFFIGDARNHQPSSALSMYSKNGTISLEEKQVLWLMQSLTVLPMTAIRSTSQVLMLSMTSPCGRCMV